MTQFIITEDFPTSEIEFDLSFLSEDNCNQYLFDMKWPDGFRCVKCNHQNCWISAKHIYICTCCEHHHSLTAGTIMDSTKKPLT